MIDEDEVDLEPAETPEADSEPEQLERGASVRDHIERALKEHSDEPAEKPERKPPREKRDTPPKDANGKFTKAAPTEAAPKPDPTPSQPAATEPPTAEAAPPKTWTKEAQGLWASLPQRARDEIAKRENDMARGAEQIRQRYGAIHKTIQDLNPIFQKYGRTPDEGIAQMAAWFSALERTPQVALSELAKQYGVTTLSAQPGTAPTTQPGAAPNPTANPAQPLDPRIEHLIRTVGRMESAEQLRTQSATTESLNAWATNKPHFQAVRSLMAQLIHGAEKAQDTTVLDASGTRVDLDKIYERAIWMVPEVRDQLLKEQEAARRAERQAAADKARKAGSSVRPGAPGSAGPANSGKPPKKGMSVRESIYAAIEEGRS